jgi:hypothetical protein
MGCSHDSTFNGRYNELSEKEQVLNGSGPYLNPQFSDFGAEADKYKDNTWISFINKAFITYKDRNIFGFRKPLSETEMDDKHTYLTYGEVSNLADILAKNIKDFNLAPLNNHGEEGDLSCIGLYAKKLCRMVYY